MDGYSHRYPFKYERVSLPVNARLSFGATNNLTALRMDCRLDVQVGEIPTSFTNVTFNCFCKNSVFSRPKFCLPARVIRTAFSTAVWSEEVTPNTRHVRHVMSHSWHTASLDKQGPGTLIIT